MKKGSPEVEVQYKTRLVHAWVDSTGLGWALGMVMIIVNPRDVRHRLVMQHPMLVNEYDDIDPIPELR